jgi:hypoxanthine phosphoribosyltransferase
MSTERPSVEEYIKTHPIAPQYAKNLLNIEYTEEELTAATKELAARISEDFRDAQEGIVLIGVLKGCALFYGQLLRYITVPVETEFMQVSSYEGTESTHTITLKKDVDEKIIAGKNVIVVEDLIDTGNTLFWLVDHLKKKNPKVVKLLTLLDKPARRTADITVDYAGLPCPDKFVVGYGMDFNEMYRNIPFLAVLKPEAYQ